MDEASGDDAVRQRGEEEVAKANATSWKDRFNRRDDDARQSIENQTISLINESGHAMKSPYWPFRI